MLIDYWLKENVPKPGLDPYGNGIWGELEQRGTYSDSFARIFGKFTDPSQSTVSVNIDRVTPALPDSREGRLVKEYLHVCRLMQELQLK